MHPTRASAKKPLLYAAHSFRAKTRYFYQGFDNYERVVPGYKGFEGSTLIAPGAFLTGVFEKLVQGLDACGGVVGGTDVSASKKSLADYVELVKSIMDGAGEAPAEAKEEEEEEEEEEGAEEGGKEDEVREPAAE